ncbi:MAG: peptidylprolyl isomerase [Robiginitomaculum sp.]|nr:MAG: peptidylprolyl isomerase [Robiginitomaculum sp.]
MMTRLTVTLFGAGLLFASACADEKQAQAQTAPVVEDTASSTPEPSTTGPSTPVIPSNEDDWRDIDLENTLYITTVYGTFIIEMAPEFAPNHVAQIKTLARQKFYDDITFHRVIDGFMNQTGDPKGDGTGDSSLPNIQAEFTFRRASDMVVSVFGKELSTDGEVDTGFYKSFPIATKPIIQTMLTKDGKVEAWGLHCKGTTSMARGGSDINSGNSQFFLMRGEYTSLNQNYSIWGMTVWGRENLTRIQVGEIGTTPNFIPDTMLSMRVAADVPEADRIPVQVLKIDSDAFKNYMESLRSSSGKLPKACDVVVPSRLKP